MGCEIESRTTPSSSSKCALLADGNACVFFMRFKQSLGRERFCRLKSFSLPRRVSYGNGAHLHVVNTCSSKTLCAPRADAIPCSARSGRADFPYPAFRLVSLRGPRRNLQASIDERVAQYVKARYSKRFEITEEALASLVERTEHLHRLFGAICSGWPELEWAASENRRRFSADEGQEGCRSVNGGRRLADRQLGMYIAVGFLRRRWR